MYLKSLTIKGFKSFAEPVKVVLSPGVTVVVGPNGSGKSNVVDAIAWVLGAQGPKSLRSSKMEDVIFAGSRSKSQLGRAEVSLVLDNSDAKIQLPLSEISISRILFRSGESEYQLNGAACRLIDILDLLSDTNIGRSRHIIVGQGEVEEVVSARAEERREVIEESAGIAKYRRRRERSERRILTAQADLVRVEDLLKELGRQIRPLERQADAARRYGDLNARHKEIRAYLVGRGLKEQSELIDLKEARLGEVRRLVAIKENEARSVEMTLLQLQEPNSESQAEAGLAIRRAMVLESRLTRLISLSLEREGSLRRRLHSLSSDEELKHAEMELGGFKDEVDALDLQGEALLETQARYEAMEAETSALEEEDTALIAAELSECAAQIANLSGKKESLVATSERLHLELDRLRSRRAWMGEELLRAEEEISTLRIRLKEESVGLEKDAWEVTRSSKLLVEIEAKKDLAEEAVRTLAAQRSSTSGELASFRSIIEGKPDEGGPITPGHLPGWVGYLVDLVEVEKGYEFAFEAAMGTLVEGVLVENLTHTWDAYSALSGLQPTATVRAISELRRYISPARVSGHPLFDGVDFLHRHVTVVKDEHASLVEELLRGVFVVRDLTHAREVLGRDHDSICVTIGGHHFSRQGLFSPTLSGRAMKARIIDLTDRAAVLSIEAEKAESDLREVIFQRDHELETLRDLQKHLTTHDAQIAMIPEKLSILSSRVTELGQEVLQADAYVARLADEEASALVELESLQNRLAELIEFHSLRQRNLSTELERNRTIEARRRASEAMRSEIRVQAAQLEARKSAVLAQIASASERLARLNSQMSQEVMERELLGVRLAVLEALSMELKEAKGQLESLSLRLSMLEASAQKRAEEIMERRRQLDESLEGLRLELVKLRETLHQEEVSVVQDRSYYVAQCESHSRELGQTLEEIRSALPPPGLAPHLLEEEEAKLKARLASIGEVNPYAETELVELRDRSDFLESQIEDVRKSQAELAKVATGIEREMRQVFLQAFEEISANFAQTFLALFPGGAAELVLTCPEEPLGSGVEFNVSIPGKKVKRLSLLSGGERSLVALAFIFALFRTRPAPFMVLDEVEAALDDRNLSSFIELLEGFRVNSQILVVTHQKRTMELADVLIGVSAGPHGVSKVVREDINSYHSVMSPDTP